jgi:hypothetical protein
VNSTERQVRKRLPDVYEHARANGWIIMPGRSGKGHVVMVHENTGRKATAASSASDHRAQKNTVSWMRKIERGVTSANND